jgi:RNA polymerase sigma-70 factor (ECF subfamily)
MDQNKNINQLVDHLFRHESGKMIAVLSRLLGLQNIEIAQDIVQDTLLQAMSTWSYKSIPIILPHGCIVLQKIKPLIF